MSGSGGSRVGNKEVEEVGEERWVDICEVRATSDTNVCVRRESKEP